MDGFGGEGARVVLEPLTWTPPIGIVTLVCLLSHTIFGLVVIVRTAAHHHGPCLCPSHILYTQPTSMLPSRFSDEAIIVSIVSLFITISCLLRIALTLIE